MTVSTDSRWQALAGRAAMALGATSPDITRAILAQWQCEQGNVWPPTRNNPGNVAKGWADGVGIPYTVTWPNPQPSNPIVSYATPELGASSYAAGLIKFARYAKVRDAVRAGDGAAFLQAVTSAGYGTGYTCSIGVYRQNGGVHVAPGGSLPSSSTPATPASNDPVGDMLAALVPDIGKMISDTLGRGIVLLFILAGILLGAWLLFREPAVQIVAGRAGG